MDVCKRAFKPITYKTYNPTTKSVKVKSTFSQSCRPENCGSLKDKLMLSYQELQYITCVRTQYEILIPPRNLFTNVPHGDNFEDPICKNENLVWNPNYIGHLTTDTLNINMNAANLRAK
jgi:hypothetical protein